MSRKPWRYTPDLDLTAIKARAEQHRQAHVNVSSDTGDWDTACASATDVLALVAEVERLRAARVERIHGRRTRWQITREGYAALAASEANDG